MLQPNYPQISPRMIETHTHTHHTYAQTLTNALRYAILEKSVGRGEMVVARTSLICSIEINRSGAKQQHTKKHTAIPGSECEMEVPKVPAGN